MWIQDGDVSAQVYWGVGYENPCDKVENVSGCALHGWLRPQHTILGGHNRNLLQNTSVCRVSSKPWRFCSTHCCSWFCLWPHLSKCVDSAGKQARNHMWQEHNSSSRKPPDKIVWNQLASIHSVCDLWPAHCQCHSCGISEGQQVDVLWIRGWNHQNMGSEDSGCCAWIWSSGACQHCHPASQPRGAYSWWGLSVSMPIWDLVSYSLFGAYRSTQLLA